MTLSATIPTTCLCGGRIYLVRDTTGYCGRCDTRYTVAPEGHLAPTPRGAMAECVEEDYHNGTRGDHNVMG